MRYLINKLGDFFLDNKTLQLIETYIDENDIILNTEMIITTLINFEKIYDKSEYLIGKLNTRILKLIDENEDFPCLFRIFTALVDFSYNGNIAGNYLFNKINLGLITSFINVSRYIQRLILTLNFLYFNRNAF